MALPTSRFRFLLVVVALTIFTASCAGANQSETTTEGEPDAVAFTDDAETTSTVTAPVEERYVIKVAARSSIAVSPLWIAESRGFFDDAGIDIEFVPVSDEGAVNEALADGDAPIAVLSSGSIVRGTQRGNEAILTPIVYVSATDSTSPARGSWSLIVRDTSELTTGCDLEGATIALDSLQSISAVAVREAVLRDGCDPSLVTFEEVVGDELSRRLRIGDIDGAAVTDPSTSQLLRGPNRLAMNLDLKLCSGADQCPLSVAVVRNSWTVTNQDALTAFTSAMSEAIDWISENEIEYRAELLQCCAISADDAAEIHIPNFVRDGGNIDADISRLQAIVANQRSVLEAVEAADAAEAEGAEEDAAEDDAAAESEAG